MGKRKETDLGRLELAQLLLSDAQFNLQHQHYRCAISRSYYACHHAARACLDAVGQPLQKSRAGAHSSCISVFGLHLIKPRVLPVALSETLRDLLSLRETADYELEVKNIEFVGQRSFQRAEVFLNEVKKWLSTTPPP